MTVQPDARALITGLGGFVGPHLARELAARGDQELFGSVRGAGLPADLPLLREQISICDMLDRSAVEDLVAGIKPHCIYHLAGKSDLGASWDEPEETMQTNVLGALNLIRAVLKHSPDCRLLFVSTAGVYGPMAAGEDPFREHRPVAPPDPYSVSKASAELLCLQYFASHGLQVVVARPFNHIGPGQSARFLVGRVVKLIAEIESEVRPPVLTLGNLSARRDFTDVRDVVRAYRALMDKGTAGEVYNISSGLDVEIRRIVDIAMELSEVPIQLQSEEDRRRPLDSSRLVGDSSKLRRLVGWEPKISIEQSIGDALDHARASTGRGT
ncbi:MAG: GDP-mannose 4,6-dehydratase [Chloroflexi bacterium]|nr:GDP-mannose 4,6-dehydratase [Chloroflexota bacterium]